MVKLFINLLKKKYIAILWTVIIFVLCTLPSRHLAGTDNSDKIAHLGVFLIFTFLWLFHNQKPVFIVISGFFYGIFIEFWQSILPSSFNRSGDIWDVVADSVGVIIGWGIFIFFKKKIPNI